MPTTLTTTSFLAAILCAPLVAQEPAAKAVPSVTMSPAPLTTAPRGKASAVELDFRVARGFHVNSNKPSAEYLIPTSLKLDVPTDLVIGKIIYPAGEETSFAFAPDQKLNVYSGDFAVSVLVRPLAGVLPGQYMVRGQLRYQACDNAACYPPKQLPVEFGVNVVRGPSSSSGRRNPAQSPHVHN